MTRSYALIQLLKHGGLTRAEIRDFTGWPTKVVDSVMQSLRQTDKIVVTERIWNLRVSPNGVSEIFK